MSRGSLVALDPGPVNNAYMYNDWQRELCRTTAGSVVSFCSQSLDGNCTQPRYRGGFAMHFLNGCLDDCPPRMVGLMREVSFHSRTDTYRFFALAHHPLGAFSFRLLSSSLADKAFSARIYLCIYLSAAAVCMRSFFSFLFA